jgi:SAM-dependent methyltransferase
MPEYIGNVDVAGRRCLDLGTAPGFLSFEIEKLGAREVVSFDADNADRVGFLPVENIDFVARPGMLEMEATRHLLTLKNSYWYSHQKLNPMAAYYCGDIYDLPNEIGEFEVVVIGQLLVHLRDPVTAIGQAAKLCTETLVITESIYEPTDTVMKTFARANSGGPPYIWWQLSLPLYEEVLAMCGVKIERVHRGSYPCQGHEHANGVIEVPSIVARRVSKG